MVSNPLFNSRWQGTPRALAGVLLLFASAGHATDTRTHRFEVLLDGKPIGTHRFEIVRDEDGVERVTSAASFEVKFLGIRFYRYRHEAGEVWRDGCLTRLDEFTNDNGRKLQVRGADGTAGFLLKEPADSRPRTGCVAAYAYWDRDRLLAQRELLNPQTGEYDSVRFESLGRETLPLHGSERIAHRHRLSGAEFNIDLWYSPDGQWLQLRSRAGGNRELLYRLQP